MTNRVGKPVKMTDKEFGRQFKGHVIKAISVAQRDFRLHKPRYEKFLEIIQWTEPRELQGKQEVRLSYSDRGKLERRPTMFPLKLFEKLLNRALDKGILRIEKGKIRVPSVKKL